MSTDTNVQSYRRWIEKGWNEGNVHLVDDLYTPGYISHSLGPDFPPNREGLKQFVSHVRGGVPDFRFTIQDLIAEGDRVAGRLSLSGTALGSVFGLPPTGNHFEVTGVIVARFEDGKWAEDWTNWDQLGMLQQLGVIPSAAPAGV